MANIPNTVLCAVGIVRDYYKEIYNVKKINDRSVEKKAYEWYCNTDIADSTMLAALTIHGDYDCGLSYDTIIQIIDDIFPNYMEELAMMEEAAKMYEYSQNGEDFMY